MIRIGRMLTTLTDLDCFYRNATNRLKLIRSCRLNCLLDDVKRSTVYKTKTESRRWVIKQHFSWFNFILDFFVEFIAHQARTDYFQRETTESRKQVCIKTVLVVSFFTSTIYLKWCWARISLDFLVVDDVQNPFSAAFPVYFRVKSLVCSTHTHTGGVHRTAVNITVAFPVAQILLLIRRFLSSRILHSLRCCDYIL